MYAIIGKYRARMEESGLVLKHAAGISFDLTPEETLGLRNFINVYQKTLNALRTTDPETQKLIRFVMDDEDKQDR